VVSKNEIEARLKKIFHSLFNLSPEQITADTSPDSVARWDSLQHLSLITSIEEEFNISISEQDIVDMLSFGLAVEIVSSTLQEIDA
jgi:acyl carrier protein